MSQARLAINAIITRGIAELKKEKNVTQYSEDIFNEDYEFIFSDDSIISIKEINDKFIIKIKEPKKCKPEK